MEGNPCILAAPVLGANPLSKGVGGILPHQTYKNSPSFSLGGGGYFTKFGHFKLKLAEKPEFKLDFCDIIRVYRYECS